MTRWQALLGLSVGALGACNAIVGVEDVTLRDPKVARPVDTTGNQDPTDGTTVPKPSVVNDDAGPSARSECNGALSCERLAFVTKATFTGKLGGLSGADQKCFDAAKAIPGYAGRAFRAWLSDSTANAASRIPHGTKAFRRTDKTIIATSYADLSDGTLNLPISLDETGKALTGSVFDRSVWTGTGTDGRSSGTGTHCADWGSDLVTQSGGFADPEATDASWTEVPGEPVATSSCNAMKHLYCVEF